MKTISIVQALLMFVFANQFLVVGICQELNPSIKKHSKSEAKPKYRPMGEIVETLGNEKDGVDQTDAHSDTSDDQVASTNALENDKPQNALRILDAATIDKIISHASQAPDYEVLQSLISYRSERDGLVFEPRKMLLDDSLERDQRWLDAFLTYSTNINDEMVLEHNYNQYLAVRRCRLRNWFQTRQGEKNSGVSDAPAMQDLERRRDDFTRDIWNADEGLLETIDSWNELQSELAETDVISISSVPDEVKNSLRASAQEIARSLPPKCAFVDIAIYRNLLDGHELHYCAFVITSEAKNKPGNKSLDIGLSRIELGRAVEIDAMASAWIRTIKNGQNDLETGLNLSEKLWKPLQYALSAIDGIVYVCADSMLAGLPFAALPVKDGERLVDTCAIGSLPFPGYLTYCVLPIYERYWSEPTPPELDLVISCPSVGLKHASIECNQIKQVFERAMLKVELVSSNEATAKSILSRLPRTVMAHIATHGIVSTMSLKRQRENGLIPEREFANPLDPLLFCGLVMDSATPEILSTRVLTGEQVSRIDCRYLKLVTLSACDTGKGDSLQSGGIISLTTGMHLGGAENVIGAYWRVGDESSSELMQMFYKELVSGAPPYMSLQRAQLQAKARGIPLKDWAGYFLSGVGL